MDERAMIRGTYVDPEMKRATDEHAKAILKQFYKDLQAWIEDMTPAVETFRTERAEAKAEAEEALRVQEEKAQALADEAAREQEQPESAIIIHPAKGKNQ